MDGKSWFHYSSQKEWRHSLLTGPGGSAWHASRDRKGRSGQGIGREEGSTWGTFPLLGCFQQTGWFKPKDWGFGSIQGSISKGSMNGKYREAGETVDHNGCWGSHIRNSQSLWLCDRPWPRKCALMRAQCQFKVLTGGLAKQNNCRDRNSKEQFS